MYIDNVFLKLLFIFTSWFFVFVFVPIYTDCFQESYLSSQEYYLWIISNNTWHLYTDYTLLIKMPAATYSVWSCSQLNSMAKIELCAMLEN